MQLEYTSQDDIFEVLEPGTQAGTRQRAAVEEHGPAQLFARLPPQQIGMANDALPAAPIQLSALIARSIVEGGCEFWKITESSTNWLAEIENMYRRMGCMSLQELFCAHSTIADGSLRQARRSSLIRCFLMVVITKKHGRPTGNRGTDGSGESSTSGKRLPRYLAATGRFFIDLVNQLSTRHGVRAYNVYTALFCKSSPSAAPVEVGAATLTDSSCPWG